MVKLNLAVLRLLATDVVHSVCTIHHWYMYMDLHSMHAALWLLATRAQLNKTFLLLCLSISQDLMAPPLLKLRTRQNGRMRCVSTVVMHM